MWFLKIKFGNKLAIDSQKENVSFGQSDASKFATT